MRLLAVLTALFLVPSLWGCASGSASKDPMAEHKATIDKERKRQDAMRAEMSALEPRQEIPLESHEDLGDHYVRQGNLMLAYLQYDKALRFDPGNTTLHYKLGVLFLKRGLTDDARKEFLEVLKEIPDHLPSLLGIGHSYLLTGDLMTAEEYFKRVLEIDGKQWKAHNFLGVIYNRQGKFDEALREFEAAILEVPASGMLFNNMGVSYLMQREHEKAVKTFTMALDSGGVENKVYNNLALALAKLGRFEEALEAFKRGGDEARAYNNLGYLYLLDGQAEKAVESFRRAIELNPLFYERAQKNLNRALKMLDQPAEESP